MGTLAIDIETASPFREPESGNAGTEFFEWLIIAVGFRDSPKEPPESEVLFRRGGWQDQYTADLFDRLSEWCEGREIDRMLTYNGNRFDLKHLANWAEALEGEGVRDEVYSSLRNLSTPHIDLSLPALARYEDKLWEDQVRLPLWKVCKFENVEDEKTWYGDYAFNNAYLPAEIDAKFVKGKHVGQVLGERYVNGVEAGLEGTATHESLRQLLYDYASGDVDVLFDLYDSFGGDRLDAEFATTLDEVER